MISDNTNASIDDKYQVEVGNWDKDGFIVLRGFFNQLETENVNQFIDNVWHSRAISQSPVTIDTYLESP